MEERRSPRMSARSSGEYRPIESAVGKSRAASVREKEEMDILRDLIRLALTDIQMNRL